MRTIFVGSNGIRAGWRLVIFASILAATTFALLAVVAVAVQFASHTSLRIAIAAAKRGTFSANAVAISTGSTMGAALFAASIMARIERRAIGAYGLPLSQAFRRNFAEGIIAGFIAISLTFAAMYVSGDIHINGFHEAGMALVADAFGWAVACVLLGLSEEFVFRGYLQFTLTTGTRFWFAALLTSATFALAHVANRGETSLGVLQVVLFALVLCVALKRSGNLWFGVGFHAAWDWGQTYFYGTPDSGLVTRHAFLATTSSGPAWLSGSTAGPEGSLFASVVLIATGVYVWFRYTAQPLSEIIARRREN